MDATFRSTRITGYAVETAMSPVPICVHQAALELVVGLETMATHLLVHYVWVDLTAIAWVELLGNFAC